MQGLLHDVMRALRMFRDSPTFTATAIIALALGIGVNAAIFSVVNAVLIRPVPFPESERLVFLMNAANGSAIVRASPRHFAYWSTQTDVLEDVTAWRNRSLIYMAGDRPEAVQAGTVSANYFRVLRAPFIQGRGFSAEEDRRGAAGTIVISNRFWTDRLGSDPHVLGKTLSVAVSPIPSSASLAPTSMFANSVGRRSGCRCRSMRTRWMTQCLFKCSRD